jgi:hypothetical protein
MVRSFVGSSVFPLVCSRKNYLYKIIRCIHIKKYMQMSVIQRTATNASFVFFSTVSVTFCFRIYYDSADIDDSDILQ